MRIYKVVVKHQSPAGKKYKTAIVVSSLKRAKETKNYYTSHHICTDARILSTKLKWRDV